MPSGKTHDFIALISVVPAYFIAREYLGYENSQSLVLAVSIFFSQFMFGPDLDIESTQYKRWGIFKWIWKPYQTIIGHRSKFSHGIILGPTTRILYLVGITLAITLLFLYLQEILNLKLIHSPAFKYNDLRHYMEYLTENVYFQIVLIGLFTGAAIHTLTDKIVSFFNNLF